MTINADRCAKYRQTPAGQDALKRQRTAQALKRQANRNSLKLDRRPGFEYKERGAVEEAHHCKWCGAELKGKRRLIDYCNTICMGHEFHRAYHQGEKAK